MHAIIVRFYLRGHYDNVELRLKRILTSITVRRFLSLSARDIPCSWGCWRESSNGHDGTVYAETRYEVLESAFNFLLLIFLL